MSDSHIQAQAFLNDIFESSGLSLRASADESAEETPLKIDGEDASLLLSEGAELLEALQHLVNQTVGRSLPKGERFICDAGGYRATREAELRAMARHAAERVRSTGVPFTFGPMEANERRVIHLALSEVGDLFTESVGEGAARRLQVSLKSSN